MKPAAGFTGIPFAAPPPPKAAAPIPDEEAVGPKEGLDPSLEALMTDLFRHFGTEL
jgi:hypothetical protein